MTAAGYFQLLPATSNCASSSMFPRSAGEETPSSLPAFDSRRASSWRSSSAALTTEGQHRADPSSVTFDYRRASSWRSSSVAVDYIGGPHRSARTTDKSSTTRSLPDPYSTPLRFTIRGFSSLHCLQDSTEAAASALSLRELCEQNWFNRPTSSQYRAR